jgi:hypothetical protein
MPEKEQLNTTAAENPERRIKQEIIATAGNNVRRSLEALEKLGFKRPPLNFPVSRSIKLAKHFNWL